MTGPEHYHEAERLIQELTTDSGAVYVEDGNEQVIALAQVHATLALAAVTAIAAPIVGQGDAGLPADEYTAWSEVAGAREEGDA
ncbi:hypothetical protein ACGFZR_24610 [Streptomyces sp. NPDC048241]|uniref:hypothetical protein n=1 Tax=Streptomyces sp. NPDC048241 TaxID=3365521 RepID=UPI003721A396